MARSMVRGLLVPEREHRPPTADRPGKGLKAPGGGAGERPIESRLMELQSTAGNVAVQRYIQRELAGAPIVQRDPVAGDAVVADVPGRAGGDDGVLRYGARGDDVRTLQERLNQVGAGTPKLVLDGIFGRRTQRAVRAFQRANPPLKVDGDAGPETLPALEQAVAGGGGETTTAETAPATPTPDAAPAPDATDAEAPISAADAAKQAYALGREHYGAGRYGPAYDEFSKAFEITGDASLLFNRANSLRVLGGRRNDAIALFEQFLATNVDADDYRRQARDHIEELRGTGRTGDQSLDKAMVNTYHRTAAELYGAGDYVRAYDEFSKAWEVGGDAAMLWNRAQCLRLMGGRRNEAIALYEEFRALNVSEDAKATAAGHIADLRGPARTADEAANKQSAMDVFKEGQEHYAAERWAAAYDKFTIAYDISSDPAYMFNRAQALRLVGGRREEAIALYEEFMKLNVGPEAKLQARTRLAELRIPGGSSGQPGPNAVGAPTQGQV